MDYACLPRKKRRTRGRCRRLNKKYVKSAHWGGFLIDFLRKKGIIKVYVYFCESRNMEINRNNKDGQKL